VRGTATAGVREVALGRTARLVWTAAAARSGGPGVVTVLVEWIAMLVVMSVLRVNPGSSFYAQETLTFWPTKKKIVLEYF